MEFLFLNMFIMIIILIVFVGAIIWGQVKLSKKRNKWLGLILPFVFFAFSVIVMVGMHTVQVTYTSSTSTPCLMGDASGVEVPCPLNEYSTVIRNHEVIDNIFTPMQIGIAFLTYNIPTVILLSIYYYCRKSIKNEFNLSKMALQDL